MSDQQKRRDEALRLVDDWIAEDAKAEAELARLQEVEQLDRQQQDIREAWRKGHQP